MFLSEDTFLLCSIAFLSDAQNGHQWASCLDYATSKYLRDKVYTLLGPLSGLSFRVRSPRWNRAPSQKQKRSSKVLNLNVSQILTDILINVEATPHVGWKLWTSKTRRYHIHVATSQLLVHIGILHIKLSPLCQRHQKFYSPFIGILLRVSAASKSLQACPTLCDPIDGSPPGSTIPGILQARTLESVAISFSNAWKWKVKVKSLSRVQLVGTPWAAAHQAPLSMKFSRQEYWSGLPLPSLIIEG